MWSNKFKQEQVAEEMRIVTPDGNNILVGSEEKEILTYGLEESSWENSTKSTTTWTNKSKIID